MTGHEIIIDTFYFLAVSISIIPLFRWLNLGPILGYLVGGLIVGPYGLGLISNTQDIFHLAEMGLILLFFVIGIEMSPNRLLGLKHRIFIDGTLQVLLCFIVFYIISTYLGIDRNAAILISIALSMSSTAIVLQYLKDNELLTKTFGQASFGSLLFQDLIIVPVLAVIPFMATGPTSTNIVSAFDLLIRTSGFILLLILGKFLIKPLIALVARKGEQEVFTATCLILILGSAIIVDKIGLSKPLGAFVAGIFLADSEFRIEAEKVIQPFKAMLMGLFFMAFGLNFNLTFLKEHWNQIFIITIIYILIKFIILYIIGRFRLVNSVAAFRFAMIMCQGSEFSLVVIATASKFLILESSLNHFLVTIITLSFFFTPIMARLAMVVTKDSNAPLEYDPLIQEGEALNIYDTRS